MAERDGVPGEKSALMMVQHTGIHSCECIFAILKVVDNAAEIYDFLLESSAIL